MILMAGGGKHCSKCTSVEKRTFAVMREKLACPNFNENPELLFPASHILFAFLLGFVLQRNEFFPHLLRWSRPRPKNAVVGSDNGIIMLERWARKIG